jgi:LmbE family N-acetylglucosaminyl deacetylase
MNPAARKLNIVIVGAHVDDHWFGMGPTMLKAARRGHNVTVIQAVTVYGAWPVVTGREAEFKQATAELTRQTGIRVIGLGYDYQRMVLGPELVRQIGEHLVELKPDVLFTPWEEDVNQDHVVIGRAGCLAGRGASSYLPAEHATMKLPRQIFQYALDVKARSFRREAYVDVSDVLYDSLALNNVFDELYSTSPAWPNALRRVTVTDHRNRDRTLTLHTQSEAILARSTLQGFQCGVRYADAFAGYLRAPASEDLLALI